MLKRIKKIEQVIFENGNTLKELLVRSRCILYKATVKWIPNQKARAKTLIKEYPLLNKTHLLENELHIV